MATIQEIAPAPWRMALLPASYGGVRYHVEQQQRSSGRRVALHEYPKRDLPYAEDMGRAARRYQITGYLVGPRYHETKKQLIRVLENSSGSSLIDPYLPEPMQAICERYSVTETRQRGGYCTFEMTFVEVGESGNSPMSDSASDAKASADTANEGAVASQQAAMIDADKFATP